jgi:serine phosphatase RsbU (regulator of sigma subunit)
MLKHIKYILFLTCINIFLSAAQSENELSIIQKADNIEKIKIWLEMAEFYAEKEPLKALEYSQEAATAAENIGYPKAQADALFLAGYACYNLNHYDNAINYFQQSLHIFDQTGYMLGKADCIIRIVNTNQLKGDFEEALKNYKIALTLYEELNNKNGIARSLTNIGSIYQIFGNYKEAVDFYFKALNSYEENKQKEGMAWSYLNIARLFKKMSDYEKALNYVEKSHLLYQEIAKNDGIQTGVTLCLKELGLLYFEMGQLDKAIEYSNQVLEINKESKNFYGVANTLIQLGQIYYAQQNYKTSLQKLEEALKLKKELNDNRDVALILRYLGNININNSFTDKGIKLLNESLQIAIKQNTKDEVRDAYLSLSEANLKSGNYKQAFENYKHYANLRDSLNVKETAQREMQYEFNKKQKQLEYEQELQNIELQRQRILTWSFIAGFVLMILLAFLLYRNFQEKKKAAIKIAAQKDEIQEQRDLATTQRDQIAQQNKLITDSIRYAERIQTAILPQNEQLNKIIPNHFLLFIPRNIVSGDFYWTSEINNHVIVAIADCTGHGVPGAFMSMLGVTLLNEIVNRKSITDSAEILNQLRHEIMQALHQVDFEAITKDGMDISLVVWNKQTKTLQYSGAHNPLYHMSSNELIVYEADRMPIGIYVNSDRPFKSKTIELNENDTLYLFSDGYFDQFGGEKDEKLKQKNFKLLIQQIAHKPLNEQKEILEKHFYDWKGNKAQVDDISVLGLRFI